MRHARLIEQIQAVPVVRPESWTHHRDKAQSQNWLAIVNGRPRRALGWRALSRRSAMRSIEYSIMLRGASIQVARCTETSLIGYDVEVTPSPRVPPVHQLVLGDHSKVQTSS